MAQPANEWLAHEAIRHAIELRFYSTYVVRRMISVLNRMDARLFATLTEALERLDAESFTVQRLDALLADVRNLNRAAYDALQAEMTATLHEFGQYEGAYQARALSTAMPPTLRVSITSVPVEAVHAAAFARPFQGVMLREVWRDLGDKRMKLVRQAIAQGFVEGRTTQEIVRTLRGTKAAGFADGLVNRSRREIETVTRTALSHYAGVVQEATETANADLLDGVQWLATLDGRTSETCRIRDGKLYSPISHKPIGHALPWLGGPGAAHWGCRSTRRLVLKPWRDLGVDVDEMPGRTRASKGGPVDASLTYYDWLQQQPADVQDRVLGKTRGQMFRAGKWDATRFHDDKGRWLTLDELREADEQAFSRR